MACFACDHTMQRVNAGQPRVFWCPRCGTLKTEGMVPEFQPPKLVGRAHALCCAVERVEENEYPNIDSLTPRVVAVRECCESEGGAS